MPPAAVAPAMGPPADPAVRNRPDAAQRDSDLGAIENALDKCPNTPAGTPVDATGCPQDDDKDGVPNAADKCPNTPAGATVDANGCSPDQLDDDGDGSIDEGLPVGQAPVDADEDGFDLCPALRQDGDCNDQIASINPAASEVCNGMDDDCDGLRDDGNPGGGGDCVVPGQSGACAEGTLACDNANLVCEQTVSPAPDNLAAIRCPMSSVAPCFEAVLTRMRMIWSSAIGRHDRRPM